MDFVNVPAPEGMEPLPAIVKRLGEFLEEIVREAETKNILDIDSCHSHEGCA